MGQMTKERFYDIVLTALIGAGIAFLQGLLAGMSAQPVPVVHPEVAGASAGLLKLIVNRIYFT